MSKSLKHKHIHCYVIIFIECTKHESPLQSYEPGVQNSALEATDTLDRLLSDI